MMADLHETQALFLVPVADLEGVPGGQDHLMAPPLQFPDDGDEEGNMGRVVEIDPDLDAAASAGTSRPPDKAVLRQPPGLL